MTEQVLRLNGVQKQTGLGKTNLLENYIYHGREGEEFIANTDIKRLRPIPARAPCSRFPRVRGRPSDRGAGASA